MSNSDAAVRFIAEASHDLRQPLQAIALWVELLRAGAEGSESRRILGMIHQTARSLDGFLNSLLDISRLDLGAIEVQVTGFPVHDLLQRIAATFGPMARERKLKFVVRDSRALVRSDPALLERVLSNLVSNAIRYCERGGVVVGCRKRGEHVSLEVWDTGGGIPSNRLADVFNEFVQLRPEGRSRGLGVGLGLSIVKRLAAALGHPIRVDSRVGKGSCFRVQVPMTAGYDGWQPPLQQEDDASTVIPGSFVVFIDDEEEIREAMRLLLEKWGCHTLVAASATEAIAGLSRHLRMPDLIIADYTLGDGNTGLQTILDIRSSLDEATDAVIVSGEQRAFADETLAVSGIPLLRKPMDTKALRLHLATSCLNRAHSTCPAADRWSGFR